MQEDYLKNVAEGIVDEMVDYDNRELKGFRKTIPDDIRDMLVASNPTLLLTNKPTLTLVLITNLYSADPCSSCSENVSNISEWSEKNNQFDNSLRILLVDAMHGFDDKKIWEKLKVSFEDVPVTLFFDSNFALLDIVQGTISVNYLELFWNQVFE